MLLWGHFNLSGARRADDRRIRGVSGKRTGCRALCSYNREASSATLRAASRWRSRSAERLRKVAI